MIELFDDDPFVDSGVAPSLDEPDEINTVSWRRVVPPKAIAVTYIWYDPDPANITQDGYYPIIDCDIIMNTKHDWGIGDENAFDVRNIATHEVGHVVGLADLYDESYRELTMYGYGSIGETIKSTLAAGDIAGCRELYGE